MARRIRSLVASAALALAPTAAAAQDWDGFYGGLTLGYANHDANHTFSNGAPPGSSDPDGGLFGGFLGYGYQSGQTVFGGEIDLEFADASGTFVNPFGPTSGGAADLNWQSSIRGTLGFAGTLLSNPTLYYGTMGWAFGDFDFRGGPAVAFGANGYSDELDGFTIGVGLDTRIGPNTSLRAEYRYTDYGTSSGALAPGFPAVLMPVSVEQHAVRVGLRLNF